MREEDARAELDAKLKKVENNIKKQVAKSMKAKGFDNEIIVELTGLTIQEINDL